MPGSAQACVDGYDEDLLTLCNQCLVVNKDERIVASEVFTTLAALEEKLETTFS